MRVSLRRREVNRDMLEKQERIFERKIEREKE
jgi:hypothetical protein